MTNEPMIPSIPLLFNIEPIHMENKKTQETLMLFQLKTRVLWDITGPPVWHEADNIHDAGNWCPVKTGSIRRKMSSVIKHFEKQGFIKR